MASTFMRGNLSYDRVYLVPDEESKSQSSYDRLELESMHPEAGVGRKSRTLYDPNAEILLEGLASESELESEMSYYPPSTTSSANIAINDLDPLRQTNGFEELDRLEQGLEKLKARHLILERIHMAHQKGVDAFVESRPTVFNLLNLFLVVFFVSNSMLAVPILLHRRGSGNAMIPNQNDWVFAYFTGIPPIGFTIAINALFEMVARLNRWLNVKQRRYTVQFFTAVVGCVLAVVWTRAVRVNSMF